jgi:hypothetical protein
MRLISHIIFPPLALEIAMRFAELQTLMGTHGFTAQLAGLPAENGIKNTTSLKLTHNCGYERQSSITLQKAQKHQFKICPQCHGMCERIRLYSHKMLAAHVAQYMGARLQGPAQAVYSRKATTRSALTHAEVFCNACSHVRTVSVAVALKRSNNGCPKCAGMAPLSPREVQSRAKEFGLKVLNAATYTGGSSLLDFECTTCHHTFSRIWQSQRYRGCGKCTRTFGEVLVEALCRHYLPAGKWESQMPVTGLIKEEPDTRLFYDVASPTLKVVLENHGSYHDAQTFSFNGKSIDHTLARRKELDRLKKKAVERREKLAGWKYAEFRFELANLAGLAKGTGSYLPAVCKIFRDTMIGLGFEELARAKDATITDLAKYLNPLTMLAADASPKGFSVAAQQWHGRSTAYTLKHKCGWTTKAAPYELKARWSSSETGCDWCDRRGAAGHWHTFVENMAARGWQVVNPMTRVAERGMVSFRCGHHKKHGIQKDTRVRLRSQVDDNPSLLPTCPDCRAKIEVANAQVHANAKSNAILAKFDALLRTHGMLLDEWEWKGTSVKKQGGIIFAQTYRIRCTKCPLVRCVPVHQYAAKLTRRKVTGGGCGICSRKRPLSYKRASPSKKQP